MDAVTVSLLQRGILWKAVDPDTYSLAEDMKYVDQWISTNHVNVEVRNDNGAIAGFLNIGFNLADDGGAGDGVCGAVSGFATILAGAVNSVAGQGMGLLGLFCIFA